MSQKTKSIVEALKSTPAKRSVFALEDSATEDAKVNEFEGSRSSAYSDNGASEENSDVVISEKQNFQKEATTSSEDLIARLSRLQASSKDDDHEVSEDAHYEEQPHRATSRPQQRAWHEKQQKQRQAPATNRFSAQDRNAHSRSESVDRYSNENEAEYEEEHSRRPGRRPNLGYQEERIPARKQHSAAAPIRTSRRGASARPVYEHAEHPSVRSPGRRASPNFSSDRFDRDDQETKFSHREQLAQPIRTSRGRSGLNSPQSNARYRTVPAAHKTQAPSVRESYEQRWSTDEYTPDPRGRSNHASSFQLVGAAEKQERFPPRQSHFGKRSSEDEYSEEFDHQEPERRSRAVSDSHESSSPFTGLSKTIVTKISKSVGISSVASDIHETLKNLSGTFIHDVVFEAAESTDNISFAELEPIVEQHLGRQLADLDQSFLNPNAFARWVRGLADELQVSLRNEAVLYLQQVLEFYLIELLSNSRDVAEQAGRSRVMVKDVLLASRMR